MRALITAVALFVLTVTAVGVNTAQLEKRFGSMNEELSALPSDQKAYEEMSSRELDDIEVRLLDAARRWKSDEVYFYSTMRHTACLEFDRALDAGISFFQSGAYDEYLAQITEAKLTVRHLLFDEGLSPGNIL